MFLVSWVITSWSVELSNELKPPTTKKLWLKLPISFGLWMMSCPKCFSFHLTLLLTFNFYIAASVSFLIMITEKINYKTRL
jgi:hypothetical protein